MTPLLLPPGMMCDALLGAPRTDTLAATRAHHGAPIAGQGTAQALAAEVPAR